MRAQAGDVVFLPRGPARLPVDSDEAVVTDVVAPAGHERFFATAGEPLEEGACAGRTPPDLARMMAAAAATGLRILGPPPFGER